jgi:hypothetical protein
LVPHVPFAPEAHEPVYDTPVQLPGPVNSIVHVPLMCPCAAVGEAEFHVVA